MKATEYGITIDPEFQSLIPPLNSDESGLLEVSIKSEGIRDPLIVWDNEGRLILIDGHNRYRMAVELDLDVEVSRKTFTGRDKAIRWIYLNQLARRNLTHFSRIEIMQKLLAPYAAEARKNQETAGKERAATAVRDENGQSFTSTSPTTSTCDSFSRTSAEAVNFQEPTNEELVANAIQMAEKTHIQPIDVRGEVAKATGLSTDTVSRAKKISETVIPEIQDKLRSGDVSINEAYKLTRMDATTQQAIAQKMTETGKLSDAIRDVKREEYVNRVEDIQTMEAKKVEGVFDVIVIDPPWPVQKIEREVRPEQTGLDYPVMTIQEILDLKIPTAENCHVWLWTTQKFLPLAFNVLDEWGLKYVCTFVWAKSGGFQPMGLPMYNAEFALYAHKGSPQFTELRDFKLCFTGQRRAHSEKPDEFYNMVRTHTAGRRLDMFNRRPIEGFETYGNQAK